MNTLPTISIVVPSFNQAQFLEETLQCLVDQNYPKLQVIIQDGLSTDDSVLIAQKFVNQYPDTFQLFIEKDFGQADALNRGFTRTTGEILAFLNSDDTYFPRILHRVATEISPDKGRSIIMGRCIFTGEGSRYVGVEHPAEFTSHFEQLAIWKRGFNTIPQPSVFWHRSVWEHCGGFDANEQHALDYDLFCRFSRYYTFHYIDELFSTYRMHDNSKSAQRTETEILNISITVSRKYWRSWFSPLRWRCEASFWLHNQQRHEQARHHARRAEEAFRQRRFSAAFIESSKTFVTSPRMACVRLFYGWLIAIGTRILTKLTVSSEGFTGCYPDKWIGPTYRDQITIPEDGKEIIITAKHSLTTNSEEITCRLLIDETHVDAKTIQSDSTFSLTADVTSYQGQTISLTILTDYGLSCNDPQAQGKKRTISVQLLGISCTTN